MGFGPGTRPQSALQGQPTSLFHGVTRADGVLEGLPSLVGLPLASVKPSQFERGVRSCLQLWHRPGLRDERKAFPVMAHLSKSDAQVEGQDRPARLVARPVKDGSSFAEYGLRFRRFAFPEERQAQLDQRVTFFDRMTCLSVHLTGLEQARSAPAMQAQSLKDRSLATPEVTEHGEGSAALPRTEKNPGPAEMGDRPDELACLHQSFARMPEADSPFIPAAGSKGHTRCSAQVQRGSRRPISKFQGPAIEGQAQGLNR